MKMLSPVILSWGLLALVACSRQDADQKSKTVKNADSKATIDNDVEAKYFKLAEEAQDEVVGGKVMTQREIHKALLEAADKDGDGKLSEEEKAALKAKLKEAKEEFKAKIVKKFDTNGDGKLDKDELAAGLDKVKQELFADFAALQQELMAAHKEAADKISAACGMGDKGGMHDGMHDGPADSPSEPIKALLHDESMGSMGSATADNRAMDPGDAADDAEIKKQLDACTTVKQEEREKMHALFAEKMGALREALAEIKVLMGNARNCSDKIEKGEMPKPSDMPARPSDEKISLPAPVGK